MAKAEEFYFEQQPVARTSLQLPYYLQNQYKNKDGHFKQIDAIRDKVPIHFYFMFDFKLHCRGVRVLNKKL
jgi:hypothetical protein